MGWFSADQWATIVVCVLTAFTLVLFLIQYRQTNTLKSQELKFAEKRFEHERRLWDEQERHVSRQVTKLDTLIEPIATRLKEQLTSDTEWLAEGLRKSDIFPYEDTIFGERSSHFHDEKIEIAKVFSAFLVEHLEHLLKEKERVCIFIDSGTTLYPLFDILGQLALEQRANDPRPKWIENVEIITNNLPGIVKLMRMKRPTRLDGVAAPPLSCTMLSGQPLTEYAAVTGADTEDSVRRIIEDRRKKHPRCHFVTVVTGNWVRLRRTAPVCPIPLARGHGHLELKQTIMHFADEVYVIAPLGKVFTRSELIDVNELLDSNPSATLLKNKMYKEISTEDASLPIVPDKIRLVTTVRTRGDSILRGQSVALGERFDIPAEPNVHSVDFGNKKDNRPFLVPYDPIATDINEQKHLEFPHPNTRNSRFYRQFSFFERKES